MALSEQQKAEVLQNYQDRINAANQQLEKAEEIQQSVILSFIDEAERRRLRIAFASIKAAVREIAKIETAREALIHYDVFTPDDFLKR